jgi:hypothetical protein
MGFLDRLLGRQSDARAARPAMSDDDRAIERYRYLLQTAPPEQIELAHEEAFAQLTPEQRREVLEALAAETPEAERPTADDPRSLARAATRAEMRQPGTLERSFGGRGGTGMGMGMGGIFAGSMLGSIAGVFIGTAIAQQMLAEDPAGDPGADESGGDHGGDAGTDHQAYGGDGGGFDGGGFDGGGFDAGGF